METVKSLAELVKSEKWVTEVDDDPVIWDVAKAAMICLHIFRNDETVLKSFKLSPSQKLAIANERSFWESIHWRSWDYMIEKLKFLDSQVFQIFPNEESLIRVSYHFKKRAIHRFTAEEIKETLIPLIEINHPWILEKNPVKGIKVPYINNGIKLISSVQGEGKVEYVSCIKPKKPKKKDDTVKENHQSPKKGKKNKETRAERRLRKALEKKERD